MSLSAFSDRIVSIIPYIIIILFLLSKFNILSDPHPPITSLCLFSQFIYDTSWSIIGYNLKPEEAEYKVDKYPYI